MRISTATALAGLTTISLQVGSSVAVIASNEGVPGGYPTTMPTDAPVISTLVSMVTPTVIPTLTPPSSSEILRGIERLNQMNGGLLRTEDIPNGGNRLAVSVAAVWLGLGLLVVANL